MNKSNWIVLTKVQGENKKILEATPNISNVAPPKCWLWFRIAIQTLEKEDYPNRFMEISILPFKSLFIKCMCKSSFVIAITKNTAVLKSLEL